MEPRHLYTIRWTQPYSNDFERPYLRQLHKDFEQLLEYQLEDNDFSEALAVINKIKEMK